MEFKNIVVILVVIIIILAAAIGFMALKPMHAKEPTKIKITSNKTLNEGDNMSVKLTDLNKTPLSKENVNIVDLKLKKGKYNVTVSYVGNENYTGNNTTQELTIKEKVVKAETSSSNTQDSSSSSSSPRESDGYWETSIDAPFEYHTEYDSRGGFRQYDRAGNLVGSSYDEDQDKIADYVPRRI